MKALSVLAALLLAAVSVAINGWFGTIFATGLTGWLYAGIFAALDCFKPAMPIAASRAFADRQYVRGGLAVLAFIMLTALSFTAGLGLYAHTKDSESGTAKAAHAAYDAALSETRQIEGRLANLGPARPVAAIAADISGKKLDQRWDRTKECTDATLPDSREFCAGIQALNAELATAKQASELRGKLDSARERLQGMNTQAAFQSADPQAVLLAKLAGIFGSISTEGVNLALSLLVATLVELIGGLGLWLATGSRHEAKAPAAPAAAPVEPASVRQATPRPRKVATRSKRTVPADILAEVEQWTRATLTARPGAALPASALWDAYAASGGELTNARFGAALAELGCRKEKRNGKVQYVGLAFRQPDLRIVEHRHSP